MNLGGMILSPPCESTLIPHPVGVQPLTNPTLGHGEDDDDSDDDDYLPPSKPIQQQPKVLNPPADDQEPAMEPPASPPPNSPPEQPPKPHRKLVQRKKVEERPPTPPSPTPAKSLEELVEHSDSPDPIVEAPQRDDELYTWREGNLEDEQPPWEDEDSIDPLVDPKYNPSAFMVVMDTVEKIEPPQTFEGAMRSPYAEKWMEACKEEMEGLQNNQTWKLIDNPGDHPVLTGKWVFATKVLSPTQVRFKARWVARGFTQQYGVDYKETFAAVMHAQSWHILIALAAQTGFKIRQFDVSNAFLNGKLTEKIYIEQPHGFAVGQNKICRLTKSLYGLKQAANVWNQELEHILTNQMHFTQIVSDSVVFVRNTDQGKVIVGGHVDDLLVLAPTNDHLDQFGKELASHLKIKFGDLEVFLGVEVEQDPTTGTISIHQHRKIVSLLTDCGMIDAKPVSTPMQPNVNLSRADCPTTAVERHGIDATEYRSIVGKLMHIMTMSRPDICAAVKQLAEAFDNPGMNHINALRWLLRYLAGSRDFVITYLGWKDPRRTKSNVKLHGYYDADWARDEHDSKSRSGYVFLIGGGAVSWWSGKQNIVATSTTHAEYVAQDSATRELVWILEFLDEIGFAPEEVTKVFGNTRPTLFGDNQSAQAIARNPVKHKLSKHFRCKLHYIREQLKNNVLNLVYCPSSLNTADVMTKPLSKQVFEKHREGMGMVDVELGR